MPANNGGIGSSSNNLSSVGGGMLAEKVVRTLYDYNPLAVMTDVINRHEDSLPDFRFWLKSWGFSRGVDAPLIGHYEKDWGSNLVKVGAITTASTGAGTDVVLTLHPDSMFNANATVNGSAAQASFVREGDIILFGGGKRARVKTKNTGVTPHRITISPINSSVNLEGATVVGTNYAIITNAFGEGTGLPAGVMPIIHKWTNDLQIIKESGGASGSEATNSLFVSFVEVENDPNSLLAVINHEMVRRFEKKCSNALLFSEGGSTMTVFADELGVDVAIKTTEGAVTFAEANGHIQTYTAGSYALSDFDNASKVFHRERVGSRTIMTLQGDDFSREVENVLIGQFNDNPIVFAESMSRAAAGGEDLGGYYSDPAITANFGFKSITKGGYTYVFKTLAEFSDITLGAAYTTGVGDTYKFPGYNIAFPLGNTKDAKGNRDFLFGYQFKQRGNISREGVLGYFGGVGANNHPWIKSPSNGFDVLRCGLVAEIGYHGACGNRIVVQKPA